MPKHLDHETSNLFSLSITDRQEAGSFFHFGLWAHSISALLRCFLPLKRKMRERLERRIGISPFTLGKSKIAFSQGEDQPSKIFWRVRTSTSCTISGAYATLSTEHLSFLESTREIFTRIIIVLRLAFGKIHLHCSIEFKVHNRLLPTLKCSQIVIKVLFRESLDSPDTRR